MKKRAPVVLALIAIVAVGLWWSRRSAPADGNGLFASGTVEATDADLGFQRPGRLASVGVREGDRVVSGAEIAALDARELDASVEAARAVVEVARARLAELLDGARPQEVAQARSALRAAADRREEARRDEERARTLFEGGAISRQAMQRAATALELATADHEQAEQRLELLEEGPRAETITAQRSVVAQAEAQLALAEATADNAVIRAPMDGLVTTRHREPGEAVGAGAPVVTLLDPDDRWVRIYVRGDAIGRVRIGTRARIRSDSYPDRAYDGEVVFVSDEAEFTPRNVQTTEERTKLVYAVKVRITGDPDFELKPGIPADVTLIEE